jgi:hypothetical protein
VLCWRTNLLLSTAKNMQSIPFFLKELSMGARGSLVVKALGYKPEGCGFETR